MSDYEKPLVLPVKAVTPERHGTVDLYLPDSQEPSPAIVFVHGGPIPAAARPTPRDWGVYQGYGSLAASRGLVGVTVDHRLHSPVAYAEASEDVTAAVELARADPRVDADRVALWFFSGGGPLSAPWLRDQPSWLRCVAATYPLLAPFPGWPAVPDFQPVAAPPLPIVLTRAGREHPAIAAGVAAFVEAAQSAGATLELFDAPNGQHGFDYLDDTDESREAIEGAFARVRSYLS